jgi:DNA-binding response OmpR family regulator
VVASRARVISPSMKTIHKILIAHPDAALRRRLVMLLAAAGCDVRSFATPEAALDGARAEWFDLAVIDQRLSVESAVDIAGVLRQIQPTLPLLLLVEKMELNQVVQGIRQGVAGVVPVSGSPLPIVRQALAFLQVETPELDEAVLGELTDLETAGSPDTVTAEDAAGLAADVRLVRLSQQNQSLQTQSQRLQEEKAGLQAELNALLAQTGEVQRLDGVLANLTQERELIAATQEAIDAKARALTELRAQVASERSALECEPQRVAQAEPAPSRTEEELTQVRAELADWRYRLEQEDDRLASDTARVRHESLQLARERRRWHEDLEVIRIQEANLRSYEGRLREWQTSLEREQVRCAGLPSSRPAAELARDDAALREAWAKLQRTGELLEAERKNFLDDRLNLTEQEKALRQREEKVRDREIKLAMREKAAQAPVPPPPKPSGLKRLTQGPFEAVRLALGATEKA